MTEATVTQSDSAVDGTSSPPRSSLRQRSPGRDRVHQHPGRFRQVQLRYSDAEYDDLSRAARCAGLTVTGYAAEAALAASRAEDPPSIAPVRAALVEVMQARTQVRRFAINVNQAVAQLNGLGEAPPWLPDAVRITSRAVARLDETAQELAQATRHVACRPRRRVEGKAS